MPNEDLVRIGISDCLTGAAVRYDGGDKRNSVVLDLIAPHVQLIPVCPEVESGMEVPREPVKLAAGGEGLKLVGVRSGTDQTDAMNEFAVRRVEELAEANLNGYIFKKGSPSCGLAVDAEGSEDEVRGLWADAVIKAFPNIPVIEEPDLADPALRQNFFERAYAYKRQLQFFAKERSVGQLTMSHVQSKIQLEAHVPGSFQELFGLFKRSSEMSYAELGELYLTKFMEVLAVPMTTAGHFNALKTAFDAVKPDLPTEAVKDLARSLQDYRQGNVPWGVPLMLLRHYVRVLENPMLNGQTYFDPGARELLLRPHL